MKILSVFLFVLVAASGFCAAPIAQLEGRVSGLESYLSHQADERAMQANREVSEIYPQTVLDSARGHRTVVGPYLAVEFLWLRAVEDGLSYAWKFDRAQVPGVADRFIKPQDQNFQFKPGFRARLGYDMDYDDWDVCLSYLWHYTHVKSSVNGEYVDGNGSVTGTLTLLPINAGSLSFVAYERGKSRWQNQLNTWDLDLGRHFYVGKHLTLHPVIGLKGALIRQHLQVFLYRADLTEGGGQGGFDIGWENMQGHFKSRFWGIGPKMGAEGTWQLGEGFSIVGGFNCAAVYGQFKTKGSLVAINTAERVGADSERVGTNNGGHVTDTFYRLRPMAHLSIGLEWSHLFWNWMNFSMHLGWEGQYFWQQMEFLNFKDLSPDGDLSLTGINAGLRFDF